SRERVSSFGASKDTMSEARIHRLLAVLVLTLFVLTACATAPTSPGPSPSGSPPSMPALQLAVLEAVGGPLSYCEPDLYPLPRGTPLENAKARFPTIEADAPALDAILNLLHLQGGLSFTEAQLIQINDDYKQMQAIRLQPIENAWSFSVLVPKPGT